MKKLLLVFLLCIFSPLYAEEQPSAVFLDLNIDERQIFNAKTPDLNALNKKREDVDNEDYIYRPMEYIKSEARELYSKKSFSNKKEKKLGKTTIGAKYDTTLAPESINQKRTLYTNYSVTEKMSVGADYQTSSFEGIEAQTRGTVGVGPEYQLNKKIKLKNKYSKNLGNDTNKGEVSIEYKPFKDGRMDFNAGAAQTQQDGGPGSSQVNFGTNFRF